MSDYDICFDCNKKICKYDCYDYHEKECDRWKCKRCNQLKCTSCHGLNWFKEKIKCLGCKSELENCKKCIKNEEFCYDGCKEEYINKN